MEDQKRGKKKLKIIAQQNKENNQNDHQSIGQDETHIDLERERQDGLNKELSRRFSSRLETSHDTIPSNHSDAKEKNGRGELKERQAERFNSLTASQESQHCNDHLNDTSLDGQQEKTRTRERDNTSTINSPSGYPDTRTITSSKRIQSSVLPELSEAERGCHNTTKSTHMKKHQDENGEKREQTSMFQIGFTGDITTIKTTTSRHEKQGEYDLKSEKVLQFDSEKCAKDKHDNEHRSLREKNVSTDADIENGAKHYQSVNDDDLVVAIAIEEEEDSCARGEDKNYVYAVEYDPNTKPPLYKNRRFRLYGFGCLALFAILAIATVIVTLDLKGSDERETVFFTIDSPSPTESPTISPTPRLDTLYTSYFNEILQNNLTSIRGTPHYNAAQWIIENDPLQLDPNDSNLLQRFMLAFFWFHTTSNGTNEWQSCNRPKQGEDDRCIYQEFSRRPNDDSEYYAPRPDKVRWLSGEDECKWVGVECAGGSAVLGIKVFAQNMTGTLPTELATLPFLQRIAVAFNEFTGSIPSEYANLKYLIDLELHGNMLTGSIPTTFFQRERSGLQNFNVGDNLLSGFLDTRIGLMSDLKGLHLFENNFEGNFPTEVGNLDYLSFARVNGNKFSGPLPSEIGQLVQLSELWYHQNQFTGTIPTELGKLLRLQVLRLWSNQFTGPIPEELYSLRNLQRFSLEENSLTGTLSTAVGQLTNLVTLRVSNNALTGPIPSEIRNLVYLRLGWMHYNQFTGDVPSEICQLVPPLNQPVGLQILQADCNGIDPPNACPCCSACCDRDLRTCSLNDFQ